MSCWLSSPAHRYGTLSQIQPHFQSIPMWAVPSPNVGCGGPCCPPHPYPRQSPSTLLPLSRHRTGHRSDSCIQISQQNCSPGTSVSGQAEGQWVFFFSGDYSELFCSLILEAQRQGVGFSPLKGTALAESSEQCLLREERKTVICSGYMEQGWGSGMEEETEEIFDDCRRPEDRSTCQRDVAHSPYWVERYHCTFFSLLTQES